MAVFGDLPTEILEKIFYHLNAQELSRCIQVCRRFKNILYDKSVEKVNFHAKEVPLENIQNLLKKGCKYLNLYSAFIKNESFDGQGKDRLNSKMTSKLKYLDMSMCKGHEKTLEWIVDSCHSLEKFGYDATCQDSFEGTLAYPYRTKPVIKSLCIQNGRTLKVLNIAGFALTSGEIQLIVEKCTNLQELSINASYIDMKTGLKTLEYLIQNLTSNMCKLGLIRNRYIGDDFVERLVKRFNKLTELNLSGTRISTESLTHIIENLGQTLSKLDVSDVNFLPKQLLELKKLSNIKILIVGHTTPRFYNNFQEYSKSVVELLKNELPPNVRILQGNQFYDSLRIGNGQLGPKNGIWEIKERQIESFPKATGTL